MIPGCSIKIFDKDTCTDYTIYDLAMDVRAKLTEDKGNKNCPYMKNVSVCSVIKKFGYDYAIEYLIISEDGAEIDYVEGVIREAARELLKSPEMFFHRDWYKKKSA